MTVRTQDEDRQLLARELTRIVSRVRLVTSNGLALNVLTMSQVESIAGAGVALERLAEQVGEASDG